MLLQTKSLRRIGGTVWRCERQRGIGAGVGVACGVGMEVVSNGGAEGDGCVSDEGDGDS